LMSAMSAVSAKNFMGRLPDWRFGFTAYWQSCSRNNRAYRIEKASN
jgi:hypothetical protein